jgi:hypothetical protein
MVSLAVFFNKSEGFVTAVRDNAVEVHFKNVLSVFMVRRIT